MDKELLITNQTLLLSRALTDDELRTRIAFKLSPRSFITEELRKGFSLIKQSTQRGQAVTAKQLEACGINTEGAIDGLDYDGFIKSTAALGRQIRIESAVDKFVANVRIHDMPFEAEAEKVLQAFAKETIPEDEETWDSLMSRVSADIEKGETMFGGFGITPLQTITNGFMEGGVYSVLADSGIGKSIFATQVFDVTSKMGVGSLFLSTEMDKNEMAYRLLSRRCGVHPFSIRRNNFSGREDAFLEAQETLVSDMANSFLVDKVTSIGQVVDLIQYYKATKGIKFVVLDHIHNLKGSKDIYERIVQISHTIQQVAQQANVAILFTSQIAKADRNSKAEDITARGASDVKDVSDVMFYLTRQRFADEDPNSVRRMSVNISKNRHGQCGTIDCLVDFNYQKIV